MPSGAQKTAAVLPVKDTRNAKLRLSGIASPAQRGSLCLAMLADMLRCLGHCAAIAQTYVVTGDAQVRRLLAEEFPAAELLWGEYTLNGAAEAAAKALADAGYGRMLFLHGDLPMVTPADVETALSAAPAYGALLLGDWTGEGTNGLVLSPPQVLPPAFGIGSLARHQENAKALGIPVRMAAEGNFARDIDTTEDLALLARQRHLQSAEVARDILSSR